jgi:hypothetical protein
LYPSHSFHRSADLHPLRELTSTNNPGLGLLARVPPRILSMADNNTNPTAFAAPLPDDVYVQAEYRSRRCFPARNQCPATKHQENLLRHAIQTDF